MLSKIYTEGNSFSSRFIQRFSMTPVVIGIVLLIVGLFGAQQVYRLQNRGDKMLSDNVASIRVAEELETTIREIRYLMKRSLATQEPRHLEKIIQHLPEASQWLNEVDTLASSAREEQLVLRIQKGHKQITKQLTENSPQNFSNPEFFSLLNNLADEVIPNKVLNYLQKYVEYNEEELAHNSQRNQSNARLLMYGLALFGSFGGLAGLFVGYFVARSVDNTIVQLSLPIRDTAGKLNEVVGPVKVSAQPGFEDLQEVLKAVSDHVSTVVERLHEQEREMLRSEQLAAVGQLAAGMAHELRNPLTALKTILQLSKSPQDLSDRDLQVLKQEVRRLEHSVQSFLDFARPPLPEKKPIEIENLLEETTELVKRKAELLEIQLEYNSSGQSTMVIADALQLRQVFLNLILNAMDAVSRNGFIRLEIEETISHNINSDPQSREVPMVNIRISDSGSGLLPEVKDRIFEPFVSTKETGLGLGLSISRRIVEAHGGTISAEVASWGGSIFTVTLPLQLASSIESDSEITNNDNQAMLTSLSKEVS